MYNIGRMFGVISGVLIGLVIAVIVLRFVNKNKKMIFYLRNFLALNSNPQLLVLHAKDNEYILFEAFFYTRL